MAIEMELSRILIREITDAQFIELREIDGISEDQVREICRTFRSGEQINP